jgi:hypothetical protein
LVAFFTGFEPERAERGDIGRQTDSEARKNDVEDNGEGELQAGQKNWVEIHGSTPGGGRLQMNHNPNRRI